MKFRMLLLLLPLFLSPYIMEASKDSTYTIESTIYDGERKFSVFLPDRYLNNPTDSFMVTYVLDAHSEQFWNMAKGNIDYLVGNYQIVNTIVVGIHAENRWCEFTPRHHNPRLRGKDDDCPRADLFQRHFAEEIFPIIELEYRVKPFRALIGHSSGGQFAVHTMFSDHSHLFDAYIAISPALGAHNEQILSDAESVLKRGDKINKFLFCSSGTVGHREVEFGGQVAQLDELINQYPNETLIWEKETFIGKDHWTCVIPTINAGMLALTRNVRAEEKVLTDFAHNEEREFEELVKEFYERSERILGYSEMPSGRYINAIGSDMQELEQYEEGIKILDWGMKVAPDEFRLPVSKANFLINLGRSSEALEAYQIALPLIEAAKDNIKESTYKGWKEFAEGRIQSSKGALMADQICQKVFDDNDFPGMSVSVMLKGQKIWSKGYGYANMETKEEVDPRKHMFRIGSVSKTLTAALMAQLYEEGKLDLYAEVQKYVPSFSKKEFPVHVNEVAHHVGGIRHYRGLEMMSNKYYSTVAEGLDIFKDDDLIYKPGTKYSYSSYGWNLISAVLEEASGEPFLESMQTHVFDQAYMKNTMPDIAHKEIANRVQFYVKNGSGENVIAPYVDNSYKWAGGGFIGTTEDLLKFGHAVYQFELYTEETQKLFTTAYTLPDGKSTSYGLGWRTGSDKKERNWVGHSGGSVGGTTMFLVYPEQELIVVTAVNLSSARTGDLAFRVANQFLSNPE